MKSFALFKQPADVKLELALRIKQIRKLSGYTQQELSDRTNVSSKKERFYYIIY